MPTQKKIYLAGSAGKLEAMQHLPDVAPQGIAVVAHPLSTMGGTMDNKVVTTLARAFVELGYATLRFNFRSVGESEGHYDEGKGETLDAITAAEYMRGEFPALPLLTAGFSFGGYVQACAAEQIQPQRMVLIAPAVGRFNMPEVASNTLLIQGDMDEVVGMNDVLLWARPQQLPILVLPGAGHFFHGRLTQLKQIVLQQFGCPP